MFKNLRALIVSLYLERNSKDKEFEELKKLINRAGRIGDRRNQIVHSTWLGDGSKNNISRLKPTAKESKGLDFKFESIKIQDLEQFVGEINELSAQLNELIFKLIELKKVKNPPFDKLW